MQSEDISTHEVGQQNKFQLKPGFVSCHLRALVGAGQVHVGYGAELVLSLAHGALGLWKMWCMPYDVSAGSNNQQHHSHVHVYAWVSA